MGSTFTGANKAWLRHIELTPRSSSRESEARSKRRIGEIPTYGD
jgi:hypothetical protein